MLGGTPKHAVSVGDSWISTLGAPHFPATKARKMRIAIVVSDRSISNFTF